MSSTDGIGRRMKFLRRQQRLGLGTLAASLDIPVDLLKKWEQGTLPMPRGYQISIARELGIDASELLKDAEEPVEVLPARMARGAKLRALRTARDISVADAALKLEISPEFLALVEAGERVLGFHARVVTAISGFLGEDATEFVIELTGLHEPSASSARCSASRGLPQLIEIEADDDAGDEEEDDDDDAGLGGRGLPGCPWCGTKPAMNEDHEWHARCPHFVFMYIPEVGEFCYATPRAQQRFDDWSQDVDEDCDEACWPMSDTALASMGFDSRLVAISVTTSGMACGPVSSTVVYGFMLPEDDAVSAAE